MIFSRMASILSNRKGNGNVPDAPEIPVQADCDRQAQKTASLGLPKKIFRVSLWPNWQKSTAARPWIPAPITVESYYHILGKTKKINHLGSSWKEKCYNPTGLVKKVSPVVSQSHLAYPAEIFARRGKAGLWKKFRLRSSP
ncbi:hypothetical protein UZ36_01150 [Candidatus Nitromaritima sp. SCGC AAA799-C22]|nr:hypothetical protein UZ36_01150 [Candidatus Nitromaritima sp. SCGC AAA799-C22]